MNIISVIQELLLPLFGAGGLFAGIFYYKQTKRVKNSEADGKEIENLKSAMHMLTEQIKSLNDQINTLQNRVLKQDELVDILRQDLNINIWKYNLKKQAINCAYGCATSDKCPVLQRQLELDEKYLNSMNRKKNKITY